MRMRLNKIVNSSIFNNCIMVVIVINCILLGVETFYKSKLITLIDNIILAIYIVEIFMRFFGRDSLKSYLKDGWNYFDIMVVLVSFAPSSGPFATLRIFRVLRVLRTLRVFPELRLISMVLIKSISSLTYTALFFSLFMYIYAVAGVTLFKVQNYVGSKYEELNGGNPDPYGSISEAFFTLFRILTGEDWTDLRYNLLKYSTQDVFVVTTFHVSWMIIASFLLLNLVIGAVVNNYDQVMKESKTSKTKK